MVVICKLELFLVDEKLSSTCRSKLKEHMQYCADHPDEISKLVKVKAQVSEVKGVMMENIEKVCFNVFLYLTEL